MEGKNTRLQDKDVQNVLQQAPFGAFQADMHGNFYFFNNEWERITGLPQQQSLGREWLSIIVPEDREAVLDIINEAIQRRLETFTFQYHISHPEKGIRYFRSDARAIYSQDGSEYYFIGFIQDITEQKELSSYLHSMISVIEDIIFELDGHLIFRQVWVKDESALFMPREQFIGKTVQEVFGDLAPLYSRPIQEAFRTGKETSIEYPHIDPAVDKWYRAKAVPVELKGELSGQRIALIIQEITDRVKYLQELTNIQEVLERNNQLLDFSQQLSDTGGWELNLETGETFWTKQVYAIYEVSEDFDKSDLDKYLAFFQPQDQLIIRERIRKGIEEQVNYVFEALINVPSGRNKWIRVFGVPIIKAEKVVALRGAVMNITREKEDAMRLLNAKNEAEQATKAKADFLSVMSHEIRTPLNGIIGITNLLKLKHTPAQKEIVNNLLFSADHLLRLINDILDLSKMENSKLELIQAEIDLPGLIRNIRNQFSSLAEVKGIRLVSLLDQEIPTRLIGDPTRLSQILNNLVSNAVKYTDRGTVTLSIQVVARKEQNVSLHFSVKDTGVGIPQELQQAIFEDFRQAQQDIQRAHSGTGLGLAITRRLIELHHSQIYLDSKPGKGSEFYFELSFEVLDTDAPSALPAISAEISAYEQKLGGLNILLVEDNHVNLMVTREQMEYFGIIPHCAVGGADALKLLKLNTYHAAFVDLHMPDMDGYQLSAILNERYPGTEIIIFTADIMSDVRIKLAKTGVHTILNKPFVPEEMLRILLKIKEEKMV
ncbi:PAS domain S-box-containing protein [bacterium A37T11]|nr:PAS domain S-box-containing protein [bacterium A37T11]